jgi:hypothetical protein
MSLSPTTPAPMGWFLCVITDKDGTGGSALYSFEEVWQVDGALEVKGGGRYGDKDVNPGRCLTGADLAVDDYALVRPADGEGGLAWELLPADLSGGGGLSITGTDNRIVRMNGTSAIQDSAVTVDDSGNVGSANSFFCSAGSGYYSVLSGTGVELQNGGEVEMWGGRILIGDSLTTAPLSGLTYSIIEEHRFFAQATTGLGGNRSAYLGTLFPDETGSQDSGMLILGAVNSTGTAGNDITVRLFARHSSNDPHSLGVNLAVLYSPESAGGASLLVERGYAVGLLSGTPQLGVTGSLGPGAAVTGGIVTSLGSGSFGDVTAAGDNTFTGVNTFDGDGIKIKGASGSSGVTITPGTTYSADRVFTLTTGDAARTLDISAGDVTVTVAGNALTSAADAAAQRAVLDLEVGTDVQAYDATLTALAGLTIAANSLSIGTGADAFSQVSFAVNTFPARASTGDLVAKSITDFGLGLVDDADASAARTTLGLGTLATQSGTFSGTSSGTNTGDQTITLTTDVTGSGTGTIVTTLATVNGNVGSFGSSTAIPSFTVNAKGLITAASTNVVIAPAGTLTGTTLAAGVVTSSLTSVGTIATGVWQGTVVGSAYGGTGVNNAGRTLTISTNSGTISFTSSVTLTVAATASVSGTNTGDQTIALTGDVTGSGTGSFAATIANNAVTLAKLATQAANTILANATTGAAVPTAVAISASRLVGRDASGNITGLTVGGGVEFTSGGIQRSALTGVVTAAAGSGATVFPAGVLLGYIDGYQMSRSSATTVTVTAGTCRDSADGSMIYFGAATKTLQSSGSWAAGSGNNGLDTGARANSTWYHVWAISQALGASADILLSTSASSPTMPSGYTLKRRVGSIRTDGSGNIIDFIQRGDQFLWKIPRQDVLATNPGTSGALYTLSTPLGVRTEAMLVAVGYDQISGLAHYASRCYVSSPDVDNVAADWASGSGLSWSLFVNTAVTNWQMGTMDRVWTDTSSQVRARIAVSGSSAQLIIQTRGWVDARGRDA